MNYLKNLSPFTLSFLTICFIVANATTFNIQNNGPYTVWAVAMPGDGRLLNNGGVWDLNVNPSTTGSIWARTNCQFDGSNHGKCQIDDCGGFLECQASGAPVNTLAEFELNQFNNLDFFNISLVDGFNVPMNFSPTFGGCIRGIRCTSDIIGQCPNQLKIDGGCNNPCIIFKTDQYCCNFGNCGLTDFSRFFKAKCLDAYSYPKNDETSTFISLGGTNYRVVLCPSIVFLLYFM